MSEWAGCYDERWQGDLVPDAFSHPAKMSRGLVRRIYAHAFEQGWLKEGDSVLDPFGGIGGTALDAIARGLSWTGVELEPRFVALGEQNLALWRAKYPYLTGQGRILQGDSRKLAEIVGVADAVVGSPPFLDERAVAGRKQDDLACNRQGYGAGILNHYGTSPGQLGAMKEGDVAAVISSPPFSERQPTANARPGEETELRKMPADRYGEQDGQLGAMPMHGFDSVVSSPPYECDALGHNRGQAGVERDKVYGPATATEYGATKGNIGNGSGDTFWSAAALIVAQTRLCLKPGGVAIWVCKDFVRKGKRVPFSDQWQALCESQGFRLLCRHRAMLVKHHGSQLTIEGGEDELIRESKSFFRRLAEKKGSPRIDWEDVLCLESLPFGEES